MASYHLSATIIGRSSGKSVVAAAAYRARCAIEDERQGITFNYSRSSEELLHDEIILPENAPKHLKDRPTLWNAVDAAEDQFNRKKSVAQTARQIEIALPNELSLNSQIELCREFIQKNFIQQGMIADLCIHEKGINPHAHIMLTMRKVDLNGFTTDKPRNWNAKSNLLKWREEWAAIQNKYLSREGIDIRVDHRSFDELGITLTPQEKIGVGKHAEKVARDRVRRINEILAENGRKIIDAPETALNHLSYHHATFTKNDILKYINSHSYDQEQFNRCRQSIFSSPELVRLGKDEFGKERFTTKTTAQIEKDMFNAINEMASLKRHRVGLEYIKQAETNHTMTPEQLEAFRHMTSAKNISVVTGVAGTGKSYTLGAVREAYESKGYRVKGVALSGIAAEGLQNSSGIESTTIHKKLWELENGRDRLSKKSVLVVDEAGMVGTRQMAEITHWSNHSGNKLVLVGDDQQLQAIEAGASFRGIKERVGFVSLTDIQRQKIGWQKEATRLLSGDQKEVRSAIDLYHQQGHFRTTDDFTNAKKILLMEWARDRKPDQTQLILAHRNKDVNQINKAARTILKERDRLGKQDTDIYTTKGKIALANKDRIMFLKNQHDIGIKNGSLGTVKRIRRGVLHVELDNGRHVAVDTAWYRDINYGYAATIHKSQGATVDRSYVLATRTFDKHLAYVAMSRHREDLKVYHSRDKDGFKNLDELKNAFSRRREKDLVSDYTPSQIKASEKKAKEYVLTLKDSVTKIEFKKTVRLDPNSNQSIQDQKNEAVADMKKKMVPTVGKLQPRFEPKEKQIDTKQNHQQKTYYKLTLQDSISKIKFSKTVQLDPFSDKSIQAQKNEAVADMKKEMVPTAGKLQPRFEKLSAKEIKEIIKIEKQLDRGQQL